MYLFLRDAKLLLRDSINLLIVHKVYLLLRDVKLLLRGSIYKLCINTVYPLLRDAKLLLRDSVYKLKINTSFWGIPYLIVILRFWSLILLVSKDSLCLRNRRVYNNFNNTSLAAWGSLFLNSVRNCKADDESWSRDEPSCLTIRRLPKQLSF